MSQVNDIASRSILSTKIAEKLAASKSGVILLSGHKSVGKSHLLKGVFPRLNEFKPEGFGQVIMLSTAEFDASPLQVLEIIYRVLNTYSPSDSIFKSIKNTYTRVRVGLNKNSSQNGLKLASTGALCFLDGGTSATALYGKSVTDIIINSDKAASNEPTRKSHDIDNDSDYYFAAIKKKAEALNKVKVSVIIDQAENLDVKDYRILSRLHSKKIKNLNVLLVCSSDSRGLSDNVGFLRLTDVLPPENKFELNALSTHELRIWKTMETGLSVSDNVLEHAIRNTKGLPIYLERWVKSDDTARMADTNMEMVAVDNYARLSREGKISTVDVGLLNYLSSIGSTASISSELLATALSLPQTEIVAQLTVLKQFGFLDANMGRYSIKDPMLIKYLLGQLANPELYSHQNELISGIVLDINRLDSSVESEIGLYAALINTTMGFDALLNLLKIVKYYASIGQYIHAQDSIKRFHTIKANLEFNDELAQALKEAGWQITISEGEVFNQTGKYDHAIRKLSPLRSDGCSDIDLFLVLGESYLRLNAYKECRLIYARAAKVASEKRLFDKLIKAQIRRVTISVDQEDLSFAKKIINLYDDNVMAKEITDSTRCHFFRWKARVLIATESSTDRAEVAARLALKISNSLNKRQVGNSYFVLGYILMHKLDYPNAEGYLIKSKDIAIETGNKDLEIYSLVVLSLTALMNKEVSKAKEYSAKLKLAMDYKAPLESLYVQLIDQLIKNTSAAIEPERCRDLSICFERKSKKTISAICTKLREKPGLTSLELLINNRIYL